MNRVDKEFEKLIQDHMDREADRIMAEVNSDPSIRDVVAPKEIEDRLFEQIAEFKTRHSRRNAEEEELIRLGRVYKKTYKRNRVLIAILAAVCGMSVGITCLGGPQKIVEEVRWMMAGREQTNIDTDSEDVETQDIVTEVEALEQIKKKFGFDPVKLYYMPERMLFTEATVDEVLQRIQFIYQKDEQIISYVMVPNYRTGSISNGVEDTLLEEFVISVQETSVHVKQFLVQENQTFRWRASFEHHNVQYSLLFIGLEEAEVIKVIENLYFS